ncbi:MAG: prepilin-type N-terminal cleavage/methylation domain-containing protein [Elusimicrobiaceae bacterium]|nr:prepilin-type N-terminal cleavage/methylation domain-containing protein [Elusimicrobiaceae bacterium]
MKKGFTLIELLVVVLIIGILSAVALPKYQLAVEKSRATQAIILVKAWAEAEERYYLANGTYSIDTAAIHAPYNGESLDIDINFPKGWVTRTYPGSYVSMLNQKYWYSISQTMKYGAANGSQERKRGLTCHVSNFVTDNDMGTKICKTLCGVGTLSKVWGSGELGCEIR